jgi:hypothetical protein
VSEGIRQVRLIIGILFFLSLTILFHAEPRLKTFPTPQTSWCIPRGPG